MLMLNAFVAQVNDVAPGPLVNVKGLFSAKHFLNSNKKYYK